ncbi:anthranilate synthase component II [Flavobacterium nackdongense]|uniref:Aminodeoxychorismate/anthranilate synthase component II n=1 Tax=Flavobacterium nackdongense TaxID=2547394 RepID=A0A4P6YBD7_9FLAO|nr:aminodeoxychorismate/anthranilate synthase component II [Flavobacterium nackdongense]QBN18084.1 aminodeoxychorismate/anthranilate synthase component II [Flavobacterium nackdongense]
MNNNNTSATTTPPSGAGGAILVIDNYDSFTYNLVHYLEDLNCEVTVYRNDEFDIDEISHFDKILLSPGPGIPDEAGLLKAVIAKYASTKSILGVCLGQQAIGEVFGGTLSNLDKVYHGVSSMVKTSVDDELLFEGLGTEFEVGRYHSWVVDANLPDVLEATSFDENGQVMSLRHKTFDVRGVQFHPESVLTPNGKKILENWLKN